MLHKVVICLKAFQYLIAKEHNAMLAHCKELLECKNVQVAIHPKHNKLQVIFSQRQQNFKSSSLYSGLGYIMSEGPSESDRIILDIRINANDRLVQYYREKFIFPAHIGV